MKAERRAALRTAGLDDAAEIARVHVASWRSAYVGMIPQETLDALSVERRTERWTEILARGADAREINLVATEDGRIVGFASAGPSTDEDDVPATTALLHAIYLDESAWGRGVGSALLEATMDALRQHGFEDAILVVIEANARARGFYEARGWTADGRRNECFGMDVSVEVPTLRYRRSLS